MWENGSRHTPAALLPRDMKSAKEAVWAPVLLELCINSKLGLLETTNLTNGDRWKEGHALILIFWPDLGVPPTIVPSDAAPKLCRLGGEHYLLDQPNSRLPFHSKTALSWRLMSPTAVQSTEVFVPEFNQILGFPKGFHRSNQSQFYGNPSSGTRADTCGRTDGRDEAKRRFLRIYELT
jgi:hypothetical protein